MRSGCRAKWRHSDDVKLSGLVGLRGHRVFQVLKSLYRGRWRHRQWSRLPSQSITCDHLNPPPKEKYLPELAESFGLLCPSLPVPSMATAQTPLPDLEQGAGASHFRGESDIRVVCGEDDGHPATSSACSQLHPTRIGSCSGGECRQFGSRLMETESGDGTAEVNFGESERECRICQLGLGSSGDQSIDLGCSCKGDLAAAHKNCAEDWFNIRGDRTCEICHSVAHNVAAPSEAVPTVRPSDVENVMAVSAVSTLESADHQNFWHGHRFLNFMLACMVVAFVVSWLLHFRVPSHH